MPALSCLLCAIFVLTIAVAFTGSSCPGESYHVLGCGIAGAQIIPIVVLLSEVTNISCQFNDVTPSEYQFLRIKLNGTSIDLSKKDEYKQQGIWWDIEEGTMTNITVSVEALPIHNGISVNCFLNCETDKARVIIVEGKLNILQVTAK